MADLPAEQTPLLESVDESSDSRSTNPKISTFDQAQIDQGIKHYQSLDKIFPVALSWSDLRVSVKLPSKKVWNSRAQTTAGEKTILNKVSGLIQPGTLVALMGASGAGKSTLLNVLTSRNTKNYVVSGDVRVNGWDIGQGIRNISAYVQQDDLFISTLTVREQLQFRALLRMDNSLGKALRLAKVEEVISEMGLTKCATTSIGESTGGKKGISGGERKRLSFASEALTNPPIFFCDEPTSGLDSFMSQSIVATLQRMASKGRVILCTIHQPSSDLFAMFDQILLLSEGRTAFMGSQKQAIEFFSRRGYPCPDNFNPADHYILTLAIAPGQEDECRQRAKVLCDVYSRTEECVQMMQQSEQLNRAAGQDNNDLLLNEVLAGDSRYKVSWLSQCRYLFWRSWINMLRDRMLTSVRIAIITILGVVLGLVYLRLKVDQKGIMSINGAIYLMIINTSFSTMYAVVNSFPLEMRVFLREYCTGLYRVDTYYLTKTLSEIPLFLIMNAIYAAITYWMIGLYASWDAFMIAVGVFLLITNVSISIGYLMSTLCGSVTVALAVAPPVLIPIMLFGGLFLNSADYPIYFKWLEYVSWFKYSNEILMVNQWRYVEHIPCSQNESITLSQGVWKPAPTTTGAPTQCLYRSGRDILEYNGFSEDNMVDDVIIMVAIHLGFWILSILALFVRAKRSRE